MSNFEKKNLILCKTRQKRIIIILTLSMRGPIPHYSRISAAALIRVNVYCLQHRQDNILNFKENARMRILFLSGRFPPVRILVPRARRFSVTWSWDKGFVTNQAEWLWGREWRARLGYVTEVNWPRGMGKRRTGTRQGFSATSIKLWRIGAS